MSFKRNYRGCETFATPATKKYRDNYDQIFAPLAVKDDDTEKFEAELGELGQKSVYNDVVILRADFDRLCYIEVCAMALAGRVNNGYEYDTQVQNLIDALDRTKNTSPSGAEGCSLLKFWADAEGYVLQDLVAFVRSNIGWFPRGSVPRTQMEELLARVARFEGEE